MNGNELIEKKAAKMETAGTKRNSIFAGSEERMDFMKATMRNAMLAMAGLALGCVWPATAHAQAEVAPDFYEITNAVAIDSPAMLAMATETPKAPTEFQGNISLPYGVNCAGKKLAAGEYTLAVKTEGASKTVVLHKDGNDVSLPVQKIEAGSAMGSSALLVRRGTQARTLEAVYVQDMKAILYLNPAGKASLRGRMLAAERLPIS
jgi:hypothetical protein